MEKLVFNKTKEKSSGNVNINQKRNMNSNVAHRKRFQDEYGSEEQFEPEKAGRKPPDYYRLFAGNSDDCFKLGVTCSKNSIKLLQIFTPLT
jgi:hypothetical protein